jgi:tripartite-type tricarboxylate transporter receptor subunit TctC
MNSANVVRHERSNRASLMRQIGGTMFGRRLSTRTSKRVPLILMLLVAASAVDSRADTYPAGNVIRIVAPTGPGAPPDAISRVIATEISDNEGWRVVVENRPGALQTIAMGDVLKRPADGLSIFPMSVGAMAIPVLLPDKGLQLETDFAPVVGIATGYTVLVVNPSVPATSISELVAALKAEPDKLTYSSGAFGTPAHLLGELFKLRTGVRAPLVPYPQGQQRIADLLSGTTHFAFYNTPAVVDLIAAGKLRALAVTAPKRVAALKDVPTVAEQGFPDLRMADWIGFAVKHGSPNDAIARLNASANKALGMQKVRDALGRLGYEPTGGTVGEFGNLIASQVIYWSKIVKDSGIKVSQ